MMTMTKMKRTRTRRKRRKRKRKKRKVGLCLSNGCDSSSRPILFMLRLTDPSHFVAPAAKKRKIGPETFTGPDMSADIRPKAPVAEPNTSRAEKGAVINKEEEEEDD